MVRLFHDMYMWLKCRKCKKQQIRYIYRRFFILADYNFILSEKKKKIFGRKHLFKNVDDRNLACVSSCVWQQT